MIYSTEVEHMTCVAKGPNHGPAPIPQEGRGFRPRRSRTSRASPTALGGAPPSRALQADPQRQGRRHPGGPDRNHRLFGHDPHRRHGRGDSPRQDHPRSAQHRPGVRRDQHRDARAVPADRPTAGPRPPSPRAACPSARGWRTWARACAARSGPCTAPSPRACATWRWPRAT